jgi:cytochrome b561
MFFMGFFMDDIKDETLRRSIYNIHKLIGLAILSLMLFRLFWKMINIQPQSLNEKKWQRFLERSVHWLLYLFLITMPLSGWVMSTAAGHPPQLFGWSLSLPIQPNKALAEVFVDVHNTLAFIILITIGLHFSAAMYHFFIKKDGVLQRML